jgi:hypothetical protein
MKYNIKEVNMPPEGKCIKCGARFKGWALEIYRNRNCICGGSIIIEPSKYSRIIERHPRPELRSWPMV